MPSAPPKHSMSFGELIACEDLLESHREYAAHLLARIETMTQCHPRDTCQETRQGRSCTLCKIRGADGLTGAATKALKSYKDAGNHLKAVRASLGKSATGRGSPRKETLFKSDLAKTIFLCVATIGDDLQTQRATWRARLQSEIDTSSSSAQNSGDLNEAIGVIGELPAYSGTRFVGPEANPKLPVVPAGSVLETTSQSSSSMFLVFRRCLSSDCPCGANAANATSNTTLRGIHESQHMANLHGSLAGPKKNARVPNKRKIKVEVATRETSDTPVSLGLANARTSVHTPKPETPHGNLNTSDAHTLDDVLGSQSPDVFVGLSKSAFETTSPIPGTKCDASMVADPRVYRLREQIARFDETCRTLMDWCRTWTADLGLHPRGEMLVTETWSDASSTVKGTGGYASTLAPGVGPLEPDGSPCINTTCHGRKVATQGRFDGHDETMTQEVDVRFRTEQEKLKERWLIARRGGRRSSRKGMITQ